LFFLLNLSHLILSSSSFFTQVKTAYARLPFEEYIVADAFSYAHVALLARRFSSQFEGFMTATYAYLVDGLP
jgi:hypothetical protein